jgi:hypothetical protein
MNATNRRRHRLIIATVAALLALALVAIGRSRTPDVRMDVLPAALP